MSKLKKTAFIFLFSSSLLLFFSSSLFSASTGSTASTVSTVSTVSSGQFLLMQPIEDAVSTGNFKQFKDISTQKISINLESPFNLRGYIDIAKFIEDFTEEYSPYKAEKIEWSSKQIDGNYAVQSLNVILKNKRSRQEIYYKFIFFMKRSDQWEIYYLRGLVF